MENKSISYKVFSMGKLNDAIQFKCEESFLMIVEEIAKVERRPPSAVARAIFERGLASYGRDGSIFEPEPPNIIQILNNLKKSKNTQSQNYVNEKDEAFNTMQKRA